MLGDNDVVQEVKFVHGDWTEHLTPAFEDLGRTRGATEAEVKVNDTTLLKEKNTSKNGWNFTVPSQCSFILLK